MDGMIQELNRVSLAAGADGREAQDAAFAAIVTRHAALMYRVAYALLKHPQDAEDAVQETLLKLYRTGGWNAMQDEKAFLARSVWRVGLSRLGTVEARTMRHAGDLTGVNAASTAATPEDTAIETTERALMLRLIDELPETFRQALVLSAIEGMRSHEVAAVLAVPEATVRTRVMRAKTELRRMFLELTAKEGRR